MSNTQQQAEQASEDAFTLVRAALVAHRSWGRAVAMDRYRDDVATQEAEDKALAAERDMWAALYDAMAAAHGDLDGVQL